MIVNRLKIVILADNYVKHRRYLAEHGFAALLETDRGTVLFDIGQGMVLRHNLRIARRELRDVDTVVLSHGHYDHTGALAELLEETEAAVYLHSTARRERFRLMPGGDYRQIGIPDLAQLDRFAQLRWTTEPLEIAGGMLLSGTVPYPQRLPSMDNFYIQEQGEMIADPFTDEQVLIIRSPRGVIVILGCAHIGVENALQRARELTGERTIHAVVGGMHLSDSSPAAAARVVNSMKQFAVERVITCHCTGVNNAPLFAQAWGERYSMGYTGAEFELL